MVALNEIQVEQLLLPPPPRRTRPCRGSLPIASRQIPDRATATHPPNVNMLEWKPQNHRIAPLQDLPITRGTDRGASHQNTKRCDSNNLPRMRHFQDGLPTILHGHRAAPRHAPPVFQHCGRRNASIRTLGVYVHRVWLDLFSDEFLSILETMRYPLVGYIVWRLWRILVREWEETVELGGRQEQA